MPEINDLKTRATTIGAFGDFSTIEVALLGFGEPRLLHAGVVGGSYFDVVGLRPVLGRLLGASDDGPNAAPVAVLTHRFWTSSFNSDPTVIGRAIRLGTVTATIVGVLEPSVPYPTDTEIIANVVTSPHHLGAWMSDEPPATSIRIRSMPPTDMLRDMCAHHAWADAEHWRAFEAFPAALGDAALFERLHHLHLTQSAWVWAIGDRRREFEFSKSGDFTAGALKHLAMRNHGALATLATTLDESALERRIGIPWFADPPLQVSVGQGLIQVAMHSHYHRGQNATRFRELGGEPPGTDLIMWIWKGRPAASWQGRDDR